MSDTSRRKLLKSIAAGSGAIVAGKSLPETWSKPVVDSVLLPVHAQTSDTPQVYAIGETGPCGGIVFDITNGGLNGLEAAPSDQVTAVWGCQGTGIGTSTDIGTGAANTTAILGGCATSSIAAARASSYAGGNCTDWFLPSQDELNQLYIQQTVVGGFAPAGYWSSSEATDSAAFVQRFDTGIQLGSGKSNVANVRAVRSF